MFGEALELEDDEPGFTTEEQLLFERGVAEVKRHGALLLDTFVTLVRHGIDPEEVAAEGARRMTTGDYKARPLADSDARYEAAVYHNPHDEDED